MTGPFYTDPRLLSLEALQVYQDAIREHCGDVLADQLWNHMAALEGFLEKHRSVPAAAMHLARDGTMVLLTDEGISVALNTRGVETKNVLGILWAGPEVSEEMWAAARAGLAESQLAGRGLLAEEE